MYSTLAEVPKHVQAMITRLLTREGLLSNDKADKGGLTKYGISERFYSSLMLGHAWPELKDLTRDQASLIYANSFWSDDLQRLYDISPKVAEITFDWGVNSGNGVDRLQQFLGVNPDGHFGPKSAGAMYRKLDALSERNFIQYFVDFRIAYFINICQSDPSQIKWLEGWFNRATAFRYLP